MNYYGKPASRIERRLARVATVLAVSCVTLTIAGLVLTAVVGAR
jgi:hypothetical protein